MKILLSGGHLTPAVAFIDYYKNKQSETEFVFIGRSNTQEKPEIEKRKVPFYALKAPRLYLRFFSIPLIIDKLIKSSLAARKIIAKEKPDLFLSFGGYVAVPIALAAYSQKIPIITHEQTMSMGFANRLISLFAKKVALSFPSKLAKKDKFVVTSNPMRQSLEKRGKAPAWLKEKKLPILLVTGGSQGARAINKIVTRALPELSKKYQVIHQTGKTPSNEFPQMDNYYPREWLEEQELAWVLQNAELAIARSGANSTQELKHFTIPTLFIPLPHARNNEQYLHAKSLADKQAALLLEQKKLSKESLLENFAKLEIKRKEIKKKLQELWQDNKALEILRKLVDEEIHAGKH